MATSEPQSRLTFDEVVRVLHAQKKGNEWLALCPAHDDHNPSLAISERDGKLLLHCNSHRCSFDSIIAGIRHKLPAERQQVGFHFDFSLADAQNRIGEATGYLASRGISLGHAKARGLGIIDYPGLGKALAIPYNKEVIKFRALNPPDKNSKFRHLKGTSSSSLLYGDDFENRGDFAFTGVVVVTESELDSLTVEEQTGYSAVSVSSATTCLKDGELALNPEHFKKLLTAEKIVLALDQDKAGRDCAAAFKKVIPKHKLGQLIWPYSGKRVEPKDIGEVYAQAPEKFRETFDGMMERAFIPEWRRQFKTKSEMNAEPAKFLIDGFLPEGISFLGACSGDGKTWLALSMAKALVTGEKFLGRFDVPEPVNALYMIPESGESGFRARLETMRIPEERFLCRTMSDGAALQLSDPRLLEGVAALKPVIFLDTLIRFSNTQDENSAAQNRALENVLFDLLREGARAIVGLHHAPKSTSKAEFLTLENVLRGTGDIGALASAVYGLQMPQDTADMFTVVCVKPRDFDPPLPFFVQLRYIGEDGDRHSFLDETGDLQILASDETPAARKRRAKEEADEAAAEKINGLITENPKRTASTLEPIAKIRRTRIVKLAESKGWVWSDENEEWQR